MEIAAEMTSSSLTRSTEESAVGGALGARIACELLIVLFKNNENTHTMAHRP